MIGEQNVHGIGRLWSRKQITLAEVATEFGNLPELAPGFDAFGYYRHPQAMGKSNNGVDDKPTCLILSDIGDELLVDFHHVDWEPLDVIQRRLP
jgi:hypothetical protein